MLTDPGLQLAYLASVVALVFQLARWPRLAPLFDRLPALVWTFFIPMLSTSIGILPAQSPLYSALARHLLPASLVLLLLSAELGAVARLGRTALLVMGAGILGIVMGAFVGFMALRPWLPPGAWKAVAALTGTWIGGTANLVAVGTAVGITPELQGIVIIVDTVVGYSWMGVLIALASRQQRFDAWNQADAGAMVEVQERIAQGAGHERRPPSVADMTLMIGLAIAVSACCMALGRMLPPVGQVLNAFSWGIVILTTAGLLLSLTPLARLEQVGASTLGYGGFYVLLASVGAQGDLRQVVAHPQFVLLGVVMILVHAVVLMAAVRLLRAPLFFFGAASQACLGGYASAPVVAAIYQPALAPVGLLLAVLGNVLGTYIGLAVAQPLAALGP